MKTEASKAQIDFYRTNGFLVVEEFLNPSELESWRKVTEDAVALRLGGKHHAEMIEPDNYYANVFRQCMRLAGIHPPMKELMYDPSIGKLCCDLEGIDGIRIWHDQALFKGPYGNPTSFHLDNPYWSFSSRNAISIWIALDEITLKNGCMYYLPGTHKLASFENVGIGENVGGIFKIYPEWRKLEAVAAPCPAGTAVFHNGLTAHGAGANMTPRPRRAMTCAYMPDGCTFNGVQNILPEAVFKSLRIGDPLNDPVLQPLIWSKEMKNR